MKRRELFVFGASVIAATFAPTSVADHYQRSPYSPEIYDAALASSEPVLFAYYASS